jgi:hypothetical protein
MHADQAPARCAARKHKHQLWTCCTPCQAQQHKAAHINLQRTAATYDCCHTTTLPDLH